MPHDADAPTCTHAGPRYHDAVNLVRCATCLREIPCEENDAWNARHKSDPGWNKDRAQAASTKEKA